MTDTDKPDASTNPPARPDEKNKPVDPPPPETPASAAAKPAAPENGSAPNGPPQKKKASKKSARSAERRPGRGAWLVATLALLLALLSGAGVFVLWQNQQQEQARLQQQLAQLQAGLEQDLNRQRQQEQSLQAELQQLRERQQNLSESLDTLLRVNRHLRHDWLVNEAEYLVRLASQRLVLAHDVETAIAALKAADARLQEAGDPSLIGLRKALAEDIAALQAVPRPDITGLSLQLSALSQTIDSLPLLTPKPAAAGQENATGNAPSDESGQSGQSGRVHSWRELPRAIWEDLKGLVVIREHAGPIKPLLAPEQHFFLTQNLKLQLEQARLALLNGEDAIYHERLATARKWVETWFDPDSDRTRYFLNQLAELDKVNVRPQLPELTRSYQAIQAWRARQAASPAAGPVSAPAETATPATAPSGAAP